MDGSQANNKLKNAQEIMFEILTEVDRICKKYHIEYWLDSGTLLGAVRHQDFIPWDDDLDIAMKIEDYEQFSKITQNELKDSMHLQSNKVEHSLHYDFIKIRSNKGKIVEKHEVKRNIGYHQGIFIDIFPVIAIKQGFLNETFYKSILLFIKLFSYKYLNIASIRRCLVKASLKFHIGWKENSSRVVYGGQMPFFPFGVDAESIFPLSEILFKGKEFLAPSDPHTYLCSLYGDDYMTPPPINQRKTHAYKIEIYDEE